MGQHARRHTRTPALLHLWREEFTGYSRARFLADLQAGLTVAAVALPLALAFGVASGSTAAAGLVTAIIAGVLIGFLSGGANQISGPTGAMSAVLIVVANQHGPVGLWIAGVLAGAIVLALGIFRLGRIINLIPEPVIAGFTSGIALIIAIGQIDNALGIHTHAEENASIKALNYLREPLPDINLHALIATVLVIGIMAALPRLPGGMRRVPAALLAIAFVTAITWTMNWPVSTIGAIPRTIILDDRLTLDMLSLDLMRQLIGPAIAIAALGSIESLLAGVVTGRMTGNRLNANQELVAQGVGNVVLPFFGGVPATAAIARMSVGVRAGGLTRMTSILHSLALLISAFFLAGVIAHIPMAALAGVLMITAWRMNEWHIIQRYSRERMAQAGAILVVTMAATVALDLTKAILLGIVVSLALFVGNLLRVGPAGAQHLRSFARLQTTLEPLPLSVSLAATAPAAIHEPELALAGVGALGAVGHATHASGANTLLADRPWAGVALADEPFPDSPTLVTMHVQLATLRGPLYFGTINAFRSLLNEVERLPQPTSVILDFSEVPLLDESGASAVQDLWRGLHLREQMLLLVGMSQQARDVSQRVGLTHLIGEAHLHPTRASAERDLQQRLARHPQRPASSA